MTQRESLLLERLQEAALALRRTLDERDALLREKFEPIAIVGMGCRFPGGAESPDQLWELLDEGRDAVQSLAGRWELVGARPSEEAPRWAGLLTGPVDSFDAAFFGISPREALSLDPQHRLLLEVAWEALEDAGVPPQSLLGSRTGVFVGACSTDYFRFVERQPPEEQDAYSATGNMLSVAAGRVAYTLGLQGPCLTVDTACSSSLVAVHLACRSLRARESDLALAGGVNLLLSPASMEAAARTQALAPDGRCRTFDASASGFVRGEGCGLVVLKRLGDALRDGDRIWALIRGSAMNQDGRSTGLTAPNVRAQEALLREALASARVEAHAVGFIEAHGTGTSLGDPIEVEALRAVVGAPRPGGSKCVLGAVKTNMGHLEAAAGVAGLMKAALSLRHERIPKNLNFRALNPRVRLEGTALSLATEPVPWPKSAEPRLAGVSSFGISGTNAHIVLEEAPPVAPGPAAPARSAELLVLSAKSAGALSAAAGRLLAHLDAHPELHLGDVAFSLATARSHLEHRLALAVPATSPEGLREVLAAAAEGQTPLGAVRDRVNSGGAGRVVFVFPGHGSQWVGMGQKLLAEEPVFRATIEACDRAIQAEAGWSLLAELAAGKADSQLERLDVVQPALFAMEVALAALWRSWGVEPDAVVGHSMGEVAAAHVAGALSLEDAVAIICRRSRLMRRLIGKGAMAMLELSLAETEAALSGYEDRLSVAVSNGPRMTAVTGEPSALAEVLSALEAKGVFCQRLKGDMASHSPQVDALREDLMAELARVEPREAAVPMRSTVTGRAVAGPELVASYWMDNLRQPVRFAEAVRALLDDGARVFVEISPNPILVPAIAELQHTASVNGAVVGSLRWGRSERRALLEALGALWARGHAVAWKGLFADGGRRVPLPTYAWQRERHWLEMPAGDAKGPLASPAPRQVEDEWFLELAWERAAVVAPKLSAGRWLLLGEGSGLGAALGAALKAAGHAVAQAPADDASAAGVRARLSEAFGGQAPTAVVHLGSLEGSGPLDADAVESALSRGCDSVLATVQAISAMGYRDAPRLWLVTRGAQAAGAGDVAVEQAPLLGLGRVIAREHPELCCARVDLDPARPEREIPALVAELLADDAEQEIALRGGERRVARIVRRAPEAGRRERREPAGERPLRPAAIRRDGSYLISGGLGGLGLSVAGWLAQQGAGHVVLMGRSGAASPEQQAAVAALEASGARVTVAKADVADRAQVEAVLRDIAASGMPLRGVIHAAVVLDDGLLLHQTPARLRAVMAPKAQGALHLHALTRAQPLDFFVLYASASGLLGSPGQGNYAAANTFLDALAHHRRREGLPGLSIDWGGFSEVGQAAALASRDARMTSRGLLSMTPAEGLAVLARLLEDDLAQVGVAPMDVRQWLEVYPALSASRMLSRLLAERRAGEGHSEEDGALLSRLAAAEPRDRAALLLGLLRKHVSRVLRISETKLETDAPLISLGMDSLMALELKHKLQRDAAVDVPMSQMLAGISMSRLAQLLGEQMPKLAGDVTALPENDTWVRMEL
jgi:acyl transferase domain-containing protein/aryl carrier-like protein